jgi:hypothetical protein
MSEAAGWIGVVLLGMIWFRLGNLGQSTLTKSWVSDIRGDLGDIHATLQKMGGEIAVLATITDDVADIQERARAQFPTPEEDEWDRKREP